MVHILNIQHDDDIHIYSEMITVLKLINISSPLIVNFCVCDKSTSHISNIQYCIISYDHVVHVASTLICPT